MFPVVLAACITMAVLGDVFAPVAGAITVGLCDSDALPARLGRNAVFDRFGNVFMAVVVGVFGTIFSESAPLFVLPVFAALTIVAALAIPARAIDHDRARRLAAEDAGATGRPEARRRLFRSGPLVVFAVARRFSVSRMSRCRCAACSARRLTITVGCSKFRPSRRRRGHV